VAHGNDVVAVARRDAAGTQSRAIVREVAGKGLTIRWQRKILGTAMFVSLMSQIINISTHDDLFCDKPTDSPMMRARRAAIAAAKAIRNHLRRIPRYVL